MHTQFNIKRWFSILFTCSLICAVLTFGHAATQPKPFKVAGVSAYTLMAELQSEQNIHWRDAKKIVGSSVMEILMQRKNELDQGIMDHTMIRGDASTKEIALTFDDGPHPSFTPKLLQVLKQCDVKATFFVVGEMAEKYPDLVKAEIAAGHSVGNHTYHHVNLKRISPEYVAMEIKACGEVIKSITGKAPHLFRPPGGDFDRQVAQVAVALDYTMVLWTDDPGDYASPGDAVISSRLINRASSGGVILIHDGPKQTLSVLPKVIKNLKDHGYKFVTIDEMLARRKTPSNSSTKT